MNDGAARIFLIGAGGWLGQSIGRALPRSLGLLSVEELAGHPLSSDDVIINAAGSKDPSIMQASNADLVSRLIDLARPAAARIVHLGSAAEYGIPADGRPLVETDGTEQPTSEYGRTKLAATRLLRQYPHACVLRVFNIVANPPQPGSPLEDVLGKALTALSAGRPPELWAAETYRDWVTRDFVTESVVAAAQLRPVGVFNVCSGIPVSMGDLVRALLDRQGSSLQVIDLKRVPASRVVGHPSAWQGVSGLRERLTAEAIAELLVPEQEVTA